MNGRDLKKWRTKRGLSQQGVADLVNEGLGLRYTSATISAHESAKRPIPEGTAAFYETLLRADGFEPTDEPEPAGREDSAPPPPPGQEQRQATSLPMPPGSYAKVCEELWSLIAMGFSGVGMATGNVRLLRDGAIIDADKAKLGEAWGRAAEQNSVLRNWIGSLSEGGVWLQVAFVTGGTVSKVYSNHITPLEAPTSAHGAPTSEGGANGHEPGITLVAEEPPTAAT